MKNHRIWNKELQVEVSSKKVFQYTASKNWVHQLGQLFDLNDQTSKWTEVQNMKNFSFVVEITLNKLGAIFEKIQVF